MELVVLLLIVGIAVLAYKYIKKSKGKAPEVSELQIAIQDSLHELSSQVRETMVAEKIARESSAAMLREHMLALSANVGDVRAALSNSQRRGQFGENMLEDLLKKAGLQEGIQYVKQPTMEGGRRPDFSVLLSADTHEQRMNLNIDCKFPLDNFVRFINAENGSEEQETAKRAFVSDTRNQLQQVATRDYNAGDDNLDFVVLFFPNESVYTAAIEFNPNIVDEAMDKNVVLASPNTMYGLLVIVQQSARQMQLQKNANQLFPLIEALEKQATEYFKQIDTVARNLQTLNNNFDFVTGRRKNALERAFNNISNYTKENSIEATGTLTELESLGDDIDDENYDPDSDETNIAMTKALDQHYADAEAAEEADEDVDENYNVISSTEEYDDYIERLDN